MAVTTQDFIKLHWDKDREIRGLGDLICKANHIALAVSDIGRSLWFYSDILGLQQIRRPNFDRHGAWLTMGNVELHLILGKPAVHSGDDLIVGHISLESNNIRGVLERLQELDIPFETNVSVPKGDEREGIVTQFFVRDPDGYYIELCNCEILTDFCLGSDNIYIEGYEESATKLPSIHSLSKIVYLAEKAKKRIAEEDLEKIKKHFDAIDGCNVIPDERKLANLIRRLEVYGDIVQGETEESLREVLKKTNNNVPDALLLIKAKHGGKQKFQPPAVYKNNEEKYVPPSMRIDK